MGKTCLLVRVFHPHLNLVALRDRLADMCLHQEEVNMPGMKTGQARSLFGQDWVITSTGPLWDNVLQNVIKVLTGVWEVSSFYQKLSYAWRSLGVMANQDQGKGIVYAWVQFFLCPLFINQKKN